MIGPNGAGKTTFISQLAGNLRPDGRSASPAGHHGLDAPRRARPGLARSFQVTSVFREFCALRQRGARDPGAHGPELSFWRPARAESALSEPARKALN